MRSSTEQDEIGRTVRMILARGQACAKSGLIGLTVDPTTPTTTAITFKLPGATAASGTPFLRETLVAPGTKWTTTSLRFTALSRVGGSVYMATMSLSGSYRATITGPGESHVAGKQLNTNFHFYVTLDAANQITACGGSGPKSAFRVGQGGVVQVLPANAATAINWNAEIFDLLNEFNLATSRFTPLEPGVYHLVAQVSAQDFNFGSANGPDQMSVAIYKNGVPELSSIQVSFSGYSDLNVRVTGDVIADGIADYFEVYVWHDESDVPIQTKPSRAVTNFSGYIVGGP